MTNFLKTFLCIAVVFSAFALPTTPAAASECRAFPRQALLGNYTHDQVSQMVETRLGGDWNDLVTRLEAWQKRIETARAESTPLTISVDGRQHILRGIELARYAASSKRRLGIVRCLADEAEGQRLQGFATAAGQEETPTTEVAVNTTGDLVLKVEGSCFSGGVSYKVTNLGAEWPRSVSIDFYRIGLGQPIKAKTKRIRLETGQSTEFKVRTSAKDTAVFVSPPWVKRAFAFDAELTCH